MIKVIKESSDNSISKEYLNENVKDWKYKEHPKSIIYYCDNAISDEDDLDCPIIHPDDEDYDYEDDDNYEY